MNNIQKLEEQILDCWRVTDDIDATFEHFYEEDSIDKDKFANIMIGLKELYSIKFEKAFLTLEKVTAEYYGQKSNPVSERVRETVLHW